MSSTNLILNQKTRSILVSPSLFDGATIIDSSGSDSGFPIANLKDFQPKRKWHHSPGGDPIQTHFIVDLGASSPGRVWNCAIPLFHNGFVDPAMNRWRVRTGDDPTGVGFFDSDWMPLWQSPVPVNGGPNNYQSTAFYRTRGLGAHSHFILPRKEISQEFGTYLTFGTGGQVNFGDVLDPGSQVSIIARVRFDPGQPVWDAMTVAQKGILNVLTGSSVHGGGFSIALRRIATTATVVATVNDGTNAFVADAFDVAGFVLQSGWNEIAMTWNASQDSMRIWVNGETVAIISTTGSSAIPNTVNPFRMGFNSLGSQSMNLADVERLVVTEDPFLGGVQALSEWLGLFDANLRQIEIPDIVRAAYPIDSGLGTTVEDIGPSGFDGTMSGDVVWSTDDVPVELFNRYARFDFESSNTPTWTLGRFYMGLALEPITPYGTSMPTPLGTPPRPQVTWPVRLTRDQFESIAYALAADAGNNPEVLRSWGHDTHLIDGGKPVVSVNNIAAEFPWQRQQQTVYGYISALDEVRTMNTGLIEANLTVRGM